MAPGLTDRTALNRHRARAVKAGDLFLHTMARDEVLERLAEVNRSFSKPAVIGPYPELWEGTLPGAHIVPDEPVLDLAENGHDLVIHAMALHWADDPVGQLLQCCRALEPDGLLIASLFGGMTLSELRKALAEAESRLTGGLSPRVAPMGEIRDLGALLQRARFALPVADARTITATYQTRKRSFSV